MVRNRLERGGRCWGLGTTAEPSCSSLHDKDNKERKGESRSSWIMVGHLAFGKNGMVAPESLIKKKYEPRKIEYTVNMEFAGTTQVTYGFGRNTYQWTTYT